MSRLTKLSQRLHRTHRRTFSSTNNPLDDTPPGPLTGVRVLECGNFIAGPFCGTLLGYYGAEVIKVEAPGGDQMREFRHIDPITGSSYWWYSMGRNKKSVCVDLKTKQGQDIVRNLMNASDVVVENFRPGTTERWGLGPKDVKDSLVYTRVSGYGQTGPYRTRPGFASACEATGGLRYVTGFEDRPSVRPNLSIGDTLAGIHAAFGTVMALLHKRSSFGEGQVVDAAIYESVFTLLEGCVTDYDGAGLVRGKSGSTITGIVPSNTYKTACGDEIVIGANSSELFKRLMKCIGREDIGESTAYNSNMKRVANQAFLDETINEWTSRNSTELVLKLVNEAMVPNGLIYSVKDIATDPQYAAREMLEEVDVGDGRTIKIPALSPKLTKTPGKTRWAGPNDVGQDTRWVLEEVLGIDVEEVDRLYSEGVAA